MQRYIGLEYGDDYLKAAQAKGAPDAMRDDTRTGGGNYAGK